MSDHYSDVAQAIRDERLGNRDRPAQPSPSPERRPAMDSRTREQARNRLVAAMHGMSHVVRSGFGPDEADAILDALEQSGLTLTTAPADAVTVPCPWCDGTGGEWSSAAPYKRVPCRYCGASGVATLDGLRRYHGLDRAGTGG